MTDSSYDITAHKANTPADVAAADNVRATLGMRPQARSSAGSEAAPFLERDAVLSDCGTYRYLLRRTWDHKLPRALFVMLNPSTADAEIDDATIRSCIRLSKCLSYGSFEVVNLYAFRATDPANLAKSLAPIGPKNDAIIEAAMSRCDVAICAWGAHRMAERRAKDVRSMLRSQRPAVFCLGTTKAGYPKHPLYIKSGTPLEVFS